MYAMIPAQKTGRPRCYNSRCKLAVWKVNVVRNSERDQLHEPFLASVCVCYNMLVLSPLDRTTSGRGLRC